MSSNYPEGSMRGSGIYEEEFDFGSFTCEYCDQVNHDAVALVDDWGNWEVECEECFTAHASGSRYGDESEN